MKWSFVSQLGLPPCGLSGIEVYISGFFRYIYMVR